MNLSSSWIDSIAFKPTPSGVSYLAIFLKRKDRTSQPTALLYSNCPSWLKGLILAGKGGISIGSAYNKLLKNKEFQEKYRIEFQKVEGEWKVAELRKLMES